MKKNKIIILIVVILFLAGLAVLLYPTVSDWWNSRQQSRKIADYVDEVAVLDDTRYNELWEAAKAYNASLLEQGEPDTLTEEQRAQYNKMLDVAGNGVMGFINVPSIDCTLPVYHGTEDDILQEAIGHLDWTSLPTGGESTHCVLSGHSGLPSAKLFTNLEKMQEGDIFTLHVLDEVLTYEVDQILVVLPEDLNSVQIVEGQDYCTLLTCTPYGKNTHRLLVRGHRIENLEEPAIDYGKANDTVVEPALLVVLIAVPVILILLVILLLQNRRRKRDS